LPDEVLGQAWKWHRLERLLPKANALDKGKSPGRR